MKRDKAEHLTDFVRFTKNEVINVFLEKTDPRNQLFTSYCGSVRVLRKAMMAA